MRISILAGRELHELNKIKEIKEAQTLEEIGQTITQNDWSPYVFQETHASGEGWLRSNASFSAADIFAVDVDDGLSLADCITRLRDAGLAALVATSKSHQKEKNGVICDRYRIVFPLAEMAVTPSQIKALFFYVTKELNIPADPACKDAARFFYKSLTVVEVLGGARLQVPDITRELNKVTSPLNKVMINLQNLPLSKRSVETLTIGADMGKRNKALIDVIHDAQQQQWPKDDLIDLLKSKEKQFPWLCDDEAMGKVEERYKNFTPTHAPRVPPPPSIPSALKPQIIPLNQVKLLLMKWLDDNDVAVSYNRTMYIHGAPCLVEDVVRKVVLELAGANYAVNERLLEYSLLEWVEEKRHDHLEAVKREVNGFNEERGVAACRVFLSVLKTDYNELDVTVFRHMIWQIKRKLNGFATKYEMMFVLTGGQGAGKSHALRHYLFKALGDLAYSSAGFDALSDQREGRLFSDHYAIMFDEMSGAQKADMERVKQIITSGIIKQRRMGTTSHDSIPMNASFFGTANNPLETLIRDNTGMRRFWELKVDTADITRQKWGLLGTIDYMDIWRSADENAEMSPIEPVLFDIQKTQETLRDLSIVEYLLEQNIVKTTDNLDEYSSATALQNTVSIVMGSHWSAKALSKEWQKHKIKRTHTTLGTRYGLKIVDSDVLNTLRTKYAMKLGGTDKEGYQF